MRDTPRIPPWLQQAIDATQRLSGAIRRSGGVQIPADAIADATRVIEHYQAVEPGLLRAIDSIRVKRCTVERIEQLWREYTPENWHAIQSAEIDVAAFVEESGISVVWVPRAAIIEQLIDADGGARYEALASFSDDVVDDLETALERARGAAVRGHADACAFAREAIAAGHDGHWTEPRRSQPQE